MTLQLNLFSGVISFNESIYTQSHSISHNSIVDGTPGRTFTPKAFNITPHVMHTHQVASRVTPTFQFRKNNQTVVIAENSLGHTHLPDATSTGIIVERAGAVLPRNVIGSMRCPVDDALQLDGASDPVEFLRRRDSPVVVDCDERYCCAHT